MSELQDPSGASNVSASGDVATESMSQSHSSGGDTVQLSSHKKVLGEKKALQAKYEEAAALLSALEEDKLSAEGKKDELIESYKKKVTEMQEQVQGYAFNSVANSVKAKAAEMGCVNSEALVKLVDLSALNVGSDFSVDGDEVATMLESFKKENDYLFKAKNPNVQTGVPRTNANLDPDKPDFSKMSIDEIKEYGLKNNIK